MHATIYALIIPSGIVNSRLSNDPIRQARSHLSRVNQAYISCFFVSLGVGFPEKFKPAKIPSSIAFLLKKGNLYPSRIKNLVL